MGRWERKRCEGSKCRGADDDDDDGWGGFEEEGKPLQLPDNLVSYETLSYVK